MARNAIVQNKLGHPTDGVALPLVSAVDVGEVFVSNGWLAVANQSGASGETITGIIGTKEVQWKAPAGLSVSAGNVVYADITQVTGNLVDTAAYSTTAGSNKIAFIKALADKDSNNIVVGVLLLASQHLS